MFWKVSKLLLSSCCCTEFLMIVKLLLSGCHGVLNGCQGVSRLQCSGQLPRCRYVVAMLIVLDNQDLARVFSVFPRALI